MVTEREQMLVGRALYTLSKEIELHEFLAKLGIREAVNSLDDLYRDKSLYMQWLIYGIK